VELRNRKVLVTGSGGFIGSHLVEALLRAGCIVRAFVHYNSSSSWGWLDTFPRKTLETIDVFAGDIRDPSAVRSAIKGADIVFHLAALVGIPFSYRSPDAYVDTNIKGTLNVLQACHEHGTTRVVLTSTSEVYGTAQYTPIDERHPVQGQSPYSASKIAADKLGESFFRSFGVPVVIARPFNTYGPRQSARAVIPTVITQLLEEKKLIHLGSVHPTRDFNFVYDTCKAFIALAECDDAVGKEVNIGFGEDISIGEIANLIISLIKTDARIVSEESRKRPEKSEVEKLLCNNQLIRNLTEWKPEFSLRQGLEKTIEWFSIKENLRKYKSDRYNL
jgi:NAD dependent epimerase/dehydratase